MPPPPKTKAAAPPKAAAKGKAMAQAPFCKRLHWRPLESAAVAGTVFGELRKETREASVDVSMLHAVFDQSPGTAASATRKEKTPNRRDGFTPKAAGVCLLDPKRAHTLGIVLRRCPLPFDALCEALRQGDFSVRLSEEDVAVLLNAWPTEKEQQLVVDHAKGSEGALRDMERCVRQVAAIPRCEARLRFLHLSASLTTFHKALDDGVGAMRRACKEMRGSSRWRELLATALGLGNYLNHGDCAKQRADGFTIEALLELRNFKAAASGVTALHCLCVACGRRDASFCDGLLAELRNVPLAARVSVSSLQEQLQRLGTEVGAAALELRQHRAAYAAPPPRPAPATLGAIPGGGAASSCAALQMQHAAVPRRGQTQPRCHASPVAPEDDAGAARTPRTPRLATPRTPRTPQTATPRTPRTAAAATRLDGEAGEGHSSSGRSPRLAPTTPPQQAPASLPGIAEVTTAAPVLVRTSARRSKGRVSWPRALEDTTLIYPSSPSEIAPTPSPCKSSRPSLCPELAGTPRSGGLASPSPTPPERADPAATPGSERPTPSPSMTPRRADLVATPGSSGPTRPGCPAVEGPGSPSCPETITTPRSGRRTCPDLLGTPPLPGHLKAMRRNLEEELEAKEKEAEALPLLSTPPRNTGSRSSGNEEAACKASASPSVASLIHRFSIGTHRSSMDASEAAEAGQQSWIMETPHSWIVETPQAGRTPPTDEGAPSTTAPTPAKEPTPGATSTPARTLVPKLVLTGMRSGRRSLGQGSRGSARGSGQGLDNPVRKLSLPSSKELADGGKPSASPARSTIADELAAAACRAPAAPPPAWPGSSSQAEGVNGPAPPEALGTIVRASGPNGTCGLVVTWWQGPNGTVGEQEASPAADTISAAQQRLDALVARGVLLTHDAKEELSSVILKANSVERYFAGGMSAGREPMQEGGRSPGERFLEAVAEFLTAFRGAWEEVQRNEHRWAQLVGGLPSKSTAASPSA